MAREDETLNGDDLPGLEQAACDFLGFDPWAWSQDRYPSHWWEVREGDEGFTDFWWARVVPLYLPAGREIAMRQLAARLGLSDSNPPVWCKSVTRPAGGYVLHSGLRSLWFREHLNADSPCDIRVRGINSAKTDAEALALACRVVADTDPLGEFAPALEFARRHHAAETHTVGSSCEVCASLEKAFGPQWSYDTKR